LSDQLGLIEVKTTCENCGDEFDPCNMHKVNNLYYCEDCSNKLFEEKEINPQFREIEFITKQTEEWNEN